MRRSHGQISGDSVPSDFAFSPEFSFLAVNTNKPHKYQLIISTVIKFLSYLYENSLMCPMIKYFSQNYFPVIYVKTYCTGGPNIISSCDKLPILEVQFY